MIVFFCLSQFPTAFMKKICLKKKLLPSSFQWWFIHTWNRKGIRINWAASWQNQQNGMCAQLRLVSLCNHLVWSESCRNLGSLATHSAHSEDSDQTGQMPRLIWVFAGPIVILLVLSWGGSDVNGRKTWTFFFLFFDISMLCAFLFFLSSLSWVSCNDYGTSWVLEYFSQSMTKATKWPVCPAKTQISLVAERFGL